MTPEIPEIHEIFPHSPSGFIPPGWRIGDVLVSYGIGPETAHASLEEQALSCFARMKAFAEQAGGGLENIARATAFVTRAEDRPLVNHALWGRFFPDNRNKPAYKVLVGNLPRPRLVQLNVLAILGATRTRVDVPGVSAQDPTVRIGRYVFTSRVHGTDPATSRTAPGGAGAEAEMAVRNIVDLVTRAGGTASDIVELNSFARDAAGGQALEAACESVLPPGHQPALNRNINYIPAQYQVMVEGIACLDGGSR